jgi:uncharacterized membrane protein YbaN (DUF454 family)
MKRYLWFTLGIISLIIAYIGLVTPGIPFSMFLVFSAYCFSKSSKRMHDWLYNHKHFGPFLTNWVNHKVFPLKMKYMMLAVMSSSLAILWFTTYNWKAVIGTGITMAIVAIWAWRYPSSIEEAKKR